MRCGLFIGSKVHANQSSRFEELEVAKVRKKKRARRVYTSADVKLLKQHSKARTPIAKIAKQMRRSEGSLRQKALTLGIGLGHQR
jgi:hypothetical protein